MHTQDAAPSTATPTPRSTSSVRADARAAGRLVLGALVLLFAFTALYVTAFHAPRPRGLAVGFVGTPAQLTRVQGALDAGARGGFDVRRYPTSGSRAPPCSAPTCTGWWWRGPRAIRSSWPRPRARPRPRR